MLGKRSRPTISKLAGALRSAGIVDLATSPRSTLDCRMQSPRGLKNYDQQGGVGLGIIVALDMSNTNNTNNINISGAEILAKYSISGKFTSKSSPIQVNKNMHIYQKCEDEMMDEEFTYVTCHGPNKSTTTRVYCDNGEYCHAMEHCKIDKNNGVFNISPPRARLYDDHRPSSDSDFLSSCHLCRKALHGKDIYMYRGEKAFCSTECRQRQIRIDERKEQCRSEASRSSNVSSSPYNYSNRGQIFSMGIVAV